MALGRIIRPKVYIEGVEIPCYKVIVQTAIGGPATAMIDIPPVEEFFDRYVLDEKTNEYVQKLGIQPRSLVHVFYEDSDDPDGVTRLLFEGEFVRYEYSKTVESRFIKLVAMDVSNVLSSVYVRYYSDFMTPYGNRMSVFTGQSTPNRPSTENLRIALFAAAGVNPEIMTALQDDTGGWGIAKAIREITRKALTTNTFFSGFDNRTKISSKIVTFADTQSKRLLEATQLASLLQQNMASLKESATIWDLYTMLMSLVFYYPVSITAAPFIKNEIVGFGSSDKGTKPFTVAGANSLASLLMKPMTWWTAPPNFNVIFPSQFKSFSMSRDFLSEPTRLIMSAFGVIESAAKEELQRVAPAQYTFVAPRQLAQRWDYETHEDEALKSGKSVGSLERDIAKSIEAKRVAEIEIGATKTTPQRKIELEKDKEKAEKEITDASTELNKLFAAYRGKESNLKPISSEGGNYKQVSTQLWNRNVMTADDHVSLESREDIKGIIFAFHYMSSAQVEVTKSKGISPSAIKDYLANVADYKLAVQQHERRSASMSLLFSPQLVVGFPALIVDPVKNFFGEVDIVTHILDANGIADTQVQVSFVRNGEVEFSDASRNGPGKVAFPAWLNPLYLPGNIGTEIYQKLFPENRPDKAKPGIPAASSILAYAPDGQLNQIMAAERIRKLYFSAKDHDRFASNFTRRNIASADQVFLSVMKASKAGLNYLFNSTDGASYRAAQVYANQARKVKSFAAEGAQPDPAPGQIESPSVANPPAQPTPTVARPDAPVASLEKQSSKEALAAAEPAPVAVKPASAVTVDQGIKAVLVDAMKILQNTDIYRSDTKDARDKLLAGGSVVKGESYTKATDQKYGGQRYMLQSGGLELAVTVYQLSAASGSSQVGFSSLGVVGATKITRILGEPSNVVQAVAPLTAATIGVAKVEAARRSAAGITSKIDAVHYERVVAS